MPFFGLVFGQFSESLSFWVALALDFNLERCEARLIPYFSLHEFYASLPLDMEIMQQLLGTRAVIFRIEGHYWRTHSIVQVHLDALQRFSDRLTTVFIILDFLNRN